MDFLVAIVRWKREIEMFELNFQMKFFKYITDIEYRIRVQREKPYYNRGIIHNKIWYKQKVLHIQIQENKSEI